METVAPASSSSLPFPPSEDLAAMAWVEAIVANSHSVSRNLQITHSYYVLAGALDAHLGDRDGSWCVFAAWASKQAGQFIRHDEIPPPLRHVLGLDAEDEPWYARFTPSGLLRRRRFLEYARLTAEDASAHVAAGNHLVYRRLAPLFPRFVMLMRTQTAYDPAARDAFLELLAEHDAAPGTTAGSGARDWTRLKDRMNYIVDLFWSRQQDRTLLQAPFTPAQLQAILLGKVPEPPL